MEKFGVAVIMGVNGPHECRCQNQPQRQPSRDSEQSLFHALPVSAGYVRRTPKRLDVTRAMPAILSCVIAVGERAAALPHSGQRSWVPGKSCPDSGQRCVLPRGRCRTRSNAARQLQAISQSQTHGGARLPPSRGSCASFGSAGASHPPRSRRAAMCRVWERTFVCAMGVTFFQPQPPCPARGRVRISLACLSLLLRFLSIETPPPHAARTALPAAQSPRAKV